MLSSFGRRIHLPKTVFPRKSTTSVSIRAMASSKVGPDGKPLNKDTPESVWKTLLTAEEYYILREKGTERPGTGYYNKHYPKSGVYVCAACEAPLYKAEHKFDSGCGWPAYDDEIPGAVERHEDNTFGMRRVEITCKNCGGHLGHVFNGERLTPKNTRHCVNSISVKYKETE